MARAAADAAMRGYADAALGFAEQGSVFVRDAEAALLSLRQRAEEEMKRLMDLRSCATRFPVNPPLLLKPMTTWQWHPSTAPWLTFRVSRRQLSGSRSRQKSMYGNVTV